MHRSVEDNWTALPELEALSGVQEDEFRWIYHHRGEALHAAVNAAMAYEELPYDLRETPRHDADNPFTSWAQRADRTALEGCAAFDVATLQRTPSGFIVVATDEAPELHRCVSRLLVPNCYLIDGGQTVLVPLAVLEQVQAAARIGVARWHAAAFLKVRRYLGSIVTEAVDAAREAGSKVDRDRNPKWYRPAHNTQMLADKSWRDDLGNCPSCGFASCRC